ncbi:glycoside hydrolase family 43 protein [Mucilaginibacter sp. Mucisp86]|uniref:glycoside hydrolase family 43 protein n=1 Tax=Mucilaginibacter sp. Mucisp86 TaxID=3243060 RepID=UPI0039B5DB33
MKKFFNCLVLVLLVTMTVCRSHAQQVGPTKQAAPYSGLIHVVLDRDFPDPTVISYNGKYYAYATQSPGGDGKMINIQVAWSTDHEHWSYAGDALPQKPSWASNTQNFWAPDVFFDAKLNKFVMFFSADPNELTGKWMGIAYADSPLGPFTDRGAPFMKGPGFRCIDPKAFVDPKTGKHFLYWGSDFQPLRVQEMKDDWSDFKDGSQPTVVVEPGKDKSYSNLVEGSWLDYDNGTYYLYYSGDNCCGVGANYAVMIAKADNPLGPFVRLGESDKTLNSAILIKDAVYTAPGHNSIFTDEKGNKFIAYHAIEIAHKEKGRVMCISPVKYQNGWPVVTK